MHDVDQMPRGALARPSCRDGVVGVVVVAARSAPAAVDDDDYDDDGYGGETGVVDDDDDDGYGGETGVVVAPRFCAVVDVDHSPSSSSSGVIRRRRFSFIFLNQTFACA
jgi:hypothetical protein